MKTTILGVDTGGTFTDFVYFDSSSLRVHKVLSTPDAPERAILQGIAEMGLVVDGLRVVHGSTVATNAALEGKGVRTVYIANQGLADVLTIGRQARQELYNLQPKASLPPVPEELCLETGGRLGADGAVVEALTDSDLDQLHQALIKLQPQSVAINLLFSYLDESFETRIESIIPDGVFISRSSQVLPEIKEYERGMATWLNAWVGPLVERYLTRLSNKLDGASISIMQSSGETVAAWQAGQQAVRMLLSGPAGGLVGARYVGQVAARERLLTFDMGGTSTDVALLDGEPRLTTDGRIGRYPVAVPMVDMHTIGAGGGSIGRVDAGGMLLVGPESAGADPGPACYGRGGAQATVSDANLILGRLRPDAFLGGDMSLDVEAARRAMSPVADAMGCSIEEAAMGIVEVANEHMAQALRVISVQRGEDPRDYTLVSFGGAGGLHVCALAEALDMKRALAPVHAGVLSALGMTASRPGRRFSHAMSGLLESMSDDAVAMAFDALVAQGREALSQEGIDRRDMEPQLSVDLRYQGQSYVLNLPWQGGTETAEAFQTLHQRRYGHRVDMPVELVTLRASLLGSANSPELSAPKASVTAKPQQRVTMYGVGSEVEIYDRKALAQGQLITGPALVTEMVSTLWLAPGWEARVDGAGNLLLERVS
jgi:N-methylhydantoinase A